MLILEKKLPLCTQRFISCSNPRLLNNSGITLSNDIMTERYESVISKNGQFILSTNSSMPTGDEMTVTLIIDADSPYLKQALVSVTIPGFDEVELFKILHPGNDVIDELPGGYLLANNKEEFDFITSCIISDRHIKPSGYPVIIGIEEEETYGYPELHGMTIDESIAFYQEKMDTLNKLKEQVANKDTK